MLTLLFLTSLLLILTGIVEIPIWIVSKIQSARETAFLRRTLRTDWRNQ